MKMTRVLTPLAIAVAAMVSAQQAAADMWSDGDFVVRVGASWVDPDDGNDQFRLSDDLLGLNFDVDSDTTWNISGAWLPVEHWGVELMYIGATDHDLDITGIRDGNVTYSTDRYRVGGFEASYSNAYLNWYPLSRDCMGQPYVGIGVNYTDFSDESLRGELRDFINDPDVGLDVRNVDYGLGHSWGFTGQIGVDFRFGRDSAFLVNAAVLYIDADTDLTTYYTNVALEGRPRLSVTDDVDYSPWVFNLGVGYSF
ncbi:OmpW family protein [Microbulbifer sp. ALW1]|uniref:OmpW/AlkL family protein n=1 Tax=Microbulbifer sp. (strain ALW1) TaxID=1516059 RepID=UPI00135741EC|nr:OmpW family outer membrane protein [Microbulbifer sp. ALW1]